MTRYLFDCETDGLLPNLTKIHCIVLKDLDTGAVETFVQDAAQVAVQKLNDAELIVGHNICDFDLPAIEKVYPGCLNKDAGAKARDTLILSRLIWSDLKNNDFAYRRKHPEFPGEMIGRHSLKAWGFRLKLLKDNFGETTDWAEFSQEMLNYCIRDVELNFKLWELIASKSYSEEAIELEHRFAAIIRMQERFGFAFDRAKAVELYATLAHKRAELEAGLCGLFPARRIETKTPEYWTVLHTAEDGKTEELKGTTKGELTKFVKSRKWRPKNCTFAVGPNRVKLIPFNPSSRDDIARRLIEKYSWKPLAFTGDGKPQVDDEVLTNLPYPECKPLSEYLLIVKRIGQLAEGKEAWLKSEKDGRIYGSVNTNGAVTGRCTHNHPNMAQVPRVGSPYGAECRALFVAPEGYTLVGADASGLELRCLAHFMARYDDGAYAKILLEGDIHTSNMIAMGLEDRNKAKTGIYCLLYGGGDEQFARTIGVSIKEGKKVRARLFKNVPALKMLRDAVAAAASDRGYLKGLDGRLLPVRSAHAALNTLLQSAGAVVMKRACVLLFDSLTAAGLSHGKDYGFVANIHDEWQIQVKPELADRVGRLAVESIEASGKSLGFRCPLTGQFKVGPDWEKTH